MLDSSDPCLKQYDDDDSFRQGDKENSPIPKHDPCDKFTPINENMVVTPDEVWPQDSTSVKLKRHNKVSEDFEELKLATIESALDSDNILSIQKTSKSKALDTEGHREPVFNSSLGNKSYSDIELQLNPDFVKMGEGGHASHDKQHSPSGRWVFTKRRREEYIGHDNFKELQLSNPSSDIEVPKPDPKHLLSVASKKECQFCVNQQLRALQNSDSMINFAKIETVDEIKTTFINSVEVIRNNLE